MRTKARSLYSMIERRVGLETHHLHSNTHINEYYVNAEAYVRAYTYIFFRYKDTRKPSLVSIRFMKLFYNEGSNYFD